MPVSPPPLADPFGSQRWLDWFTKINNRINVVVTDHNDLGNIQGGTSSERYHLTAAQYSTAISLTNVHNDLSGLQGGTSSQYYHLTSSQHTSVGTLITNFGDYTAVVLPSYTVAGAPTASSYTGGLIYVSNEAGGATVAFSDGTNWRRVQDRTVIS